MKRSTMESKKMSGNKNFIENFTGIRGYAIMLIFLSHCNFGNNQAGTNCTGMWGGFGVELFVLLSGYLLALNDSSGITQFKEYLKRKLKKFYPLHIVTLIATIPFSLKLLLSLNLTTWIALPLNILLLQNWIPTSSVYFSYNSVSWYLSLTLFFILISPIVIRFWNAVNMKYIPYVVIGLFLLEIAWCYFVKDTSLAHWLIYILPLVRALDLLIGGGYCEACGKKKNP